MKRDPDSPDEPLAEGGLTLAEIAGLIGAELEGDPDLRIRRPLPAGRPAGEGDLVIALQADPREMLRAVGARAAVVATGAKRPEGLSGLLVADRPRLTFGRILTLFAPTPHAPVGVDPLASVDPSATLGEGVSVGAFVTVGPGARIGAGCRLLAQSSIGRDAELGPDCLVHGGVRIGERVRLGARVIVHPNAVIGADGFSFVTPAPSSIEQNDARVFRVAKANEPVERIPSLGTVEVGDDVEIGAGTTIDRATLETTRIGARTKIDNQVQIAHNCVIGSDCLIAGQVGISGSVRIGDRVVLGGKVGIADHITIGDDAVLGAGAGVANDVPASEIHLGSPAKRKDNVINDFLSVSRIPRLMRDLLDLRKRVASLEKERAAGGRGEGRGEE